MSGGCPSKALKMVVVGDKSCGKTCLQMAFTEGHFSEEYVPTVSDIFSADFNCDSFQLEINLWDTAGEHDYDRLRPLCYNGTNVVLVCYDVTNPNSFQHVLSRIRQLCPGIPMILVACKTDLRMNKVIQRKLSKTGQEPVTFTQGLTVARQMRASGFLECSAKLNEKVVETFREAALSALDGCSRPRMRKRAERGCLVS
ncbi:rho-related GTP-binding protein RhoF-like [Mustelus asterias]